MQFVCLPRVEDIADASGLFALQELTAMQLAIDDSSATFSILETSHHQLLDEAAEVFWRLRYWPIAIQDELAAACDRLYGYRNRYKLQLQADQQQLQKEMKQLQVCFLAPWLTCLCRQDMLLISRTLNPYISTTCPRAGVKGRCASMLPLYQQPAIGLCLPSLGAD